MKLAFSTSNLLRKERYKILTSVYDDRGRIFVRKITVSKYAIPHLTSIAKSEELLKSSLPNLKFAQVIRKKRNFIDYEYLPHSTFSQLIERALIGKRFEEVLEFVKKGLEVIDQLESINQNPYHSKDFVKLFDSKNSFGSENLEECSKLGALDIRFDNLLLDNGDLYLIDYEWVYSFPLPKKYLKFRSILYLSQSLQLIINTLVSINFPCIKNRKDFLIPESWYKLLNIEYGDLQRFTFYENNFQNHVSSIHTALALDNILKPSTVIESEMENLNDTSGNMKEFSKAREMKKLRTKVTGHIKDSKLYRLWQKLKS